MSAPLREGLARHGLLADKRLGQHFLLDLNLTRKIARLAAPLPEGWVLEVGPGPGGLTRALLEEGAARVIAVEKDPRFLPLLRELEAEAEGRLQVVLGDALRLSPRTLIEASGSGPLKIVSNLPYNIGTALLIFWLKQEPPPDRLVLMFQREVAERIVAVAGSEAYGRLSVLAQAICAARIEFLIPARAFTPPPKVESAVVVLTPLPDRPAPARLSALETVTAAAFGQRRKMLRSSLKSLGGEALCHACGLSGALRAEEVDVTGFLLLADSLNAATDRR